LEDLSAINYRLQGLAEKKPKTQETVLLKRIKLGVRSERVLGWIGFAETIRSRGFLIVLLRHMKQIYSLQEKAGGYVQNRHVFSYLWTELAQAHGGPGRWGRRRSGRRGTRTRLGTGRGRQGELEDVLTGAEDEGRRPDFEVNVGGLVWRRGGAPASARGARRGEARGAQGL
jgi:hypothetical protein